MRIIRFITKQAKAHQRITVFGIIVACVAVVATAFRDDSQCSG